MKDFFFIFFSLAVGGWRGKQEFAELDLLTCPSNIWLIKTRMLWAVFYCLWDHFTFSICSCRDTNPHRSVFCRLLLCSTPNSVTLCRLHRGACAQTCVGLWQAFTPRCCAVDPCALDPPCSLFPEQENSFSCWWWTAWHGCSVRLCRCVCACARSCTLCASSPMSPWP